MPFALFLQVCRHLGRISLSCLSVFFVATFAKLRVFRHALAVKRQLHGTAFIQLARGRAGVLVATLKWHLPPADDTIELAAMFAALKIPPAGPAILVVSSALRAGADDGFGS